MSYSLFTLSESLATYASLILLSLSPSSKQLKANIGLTEGKPKSQVLTHLLQHRPLYLNTSKLSSPFLPLGIKLTSNFVAPQNNGFMLQQVVSIVNTNGVGMLDLVSRLW